LWETSTGRLVRTLEGHAECVHAVAFSPDGRRLASGCIDGTVRLWDPRTGEHTATLEGHTDLVRSLVFLPDGGHLVTAGSDKTVRVWDLSTGKVLRVFGGHAARVWSVAVTPDGRRALSAECDQDRGRAAVKLWDVATGEEVDALHGSATWVQGVAFGPRGRMAVTWDTSVVLWDREAQRRERPDLYYLGFGVSEYRDDRIPDLGFAHKDALDLEKFLSRPGKAYRKVYTRTRVNDQVTADAIVEAKSFLEQARPEDTVVLFVAGHGLHDRDPAATYYYLTYDADPEDLAGTAADFELIEDLLAGIAARNKLFLLDTCQSGEAVDEAAYSASPGGAGARGFRPRLVRGLMQEHAPGRAPRRYLAQDDRFIYVDLFRRTGAIVFSSSLGHEASLEARTFRNGVFTEAILRALGSDVADRNGDRLISTDELRAHVSRAVPEMTGGLQHPTVDRDNIHQKFGFEIATPDR
ncbi:MAG: caspase family protein, partial [Planctomycetota bacterium]